MAFRLLLRLNLVSAKIMQRAALGFTMKKKNKIEVSTVTSFLDSQSEQEAGRYVFSYTITIHNLGSASAKLLSRHWVITDANGKVQEVHGEGVVGEQPHLAPGEYFRYTSAAMIETPVGVMRGEYQMISDDGEFFDAVIPPFTLAIPRVLH
jgi:ApaG protein